MNKLKIIVPVLLLAGCNSIYVKPNTIDKTDVVYIESGGDQMHQAVKQHFESRGYVVTVGHKKHTINTTYIVPDDNQSIIKKSDLGRARFIVQIDEKQPKFNPAWCVLNGFWWWKFNVSIVDNTKDEEIMTWVGRGCKNSSLRKLDSILNKMEKNDL